jgi:hypothetical protein
MDWIHRTGIEGKTHRIVRISQDSQEWCRGKGGRVEPWERGGFRGLEIQRGT